MGIVYMGWSKHVLEVVRIYKEHVTRYLSKDYRLPKQAKNPFFRGYLELDVSPALGQDETHYYQPLIGVTRWTIKIGHINFNTKVSLLLLYLAIMRQWHTKAVLHVTVS